jgi:hypothetical protein
VPIGGIAAVGVLSLLRVKQNLQLEEGRFISRIKQSDPVGNFLFISAVICLLLTLEWGGSKYAWTNGRIIALFTLFGVLFIAFVAVQFWQGENAAGMLELM